MDPLIAAWSRALRANNNAPTTIITYQNSLTDFARFSALPAATRDDVREYLAASLDRGFAVSTVRLRLVILRAFYRWAVAEDRLPTDVTAGIRGPGKPEQHTPTLSVEQVEALLDVTSGRRFNDRRDRAIIRLLLDTGARADECVRLVIGDVDLDRRIVEFQGKGAGRSGKRTRDGAIGLVTARDIDRYLVARATHKAADSAALWLGQQGAIGYGALRDMIRTRGRQAGFELHAHMLRHTWASDFRRAGGSEGDLMQLGGWRSRTMLDRYGAVDASSRAIETAQRLSYSDRIRNATNARGRP